MIVVILYVAAEGPSASSPKTKFIATSLQIVIGWSATTGSGFMVAVILNASPLHPVAVTGTTV